MIKNAFKHLKTLLTHKFWVMYYCYKAGLYWQGITHDLSKFSIDEFSESVKYYTGTASPINEAKKDKGYSLAWLHHRGRNKHHHLYWVDELDAENPVLIKMPYKYTMEMICDFLAAGRTYMKDFSYEAEYEWWLNRMNELPNMKMHPSTKRFVTEVLHYIMLYGSIEILSDKDFLEYEYSISED
jgi:hypothetical protein